MDWACAAAIPMGESTKASRQALEIAVFGRMLNLDWERANRLNRYCTSKRNRPIF